MRRYVLLALVVGGLIAGGLIARSLIAAKPDTDKELGKFDGTWLVTAVEVSGTKIPEAELQKAPSRVTLQGGKWALKAPGREESGTFTVDEARAPREMDVNPANGPNAGKTFKAIYRLDGDVMRVSYAAPGQDRPTSFVTTDKPGYWVNTYQREKPAQ